MRRGGRARRKDAGGPVRVHAEHADVYQTEGGNHKWRDAGDDAEQYKKGGALTEVSKKTSKGGLHRSLGIPEGQKIGHKRIMEAEHSPRAKVRRQAQLAETYEKHRPD